MLQPLPPAALFAARLVAAAAALVPDLVAGHRLTRAELNAAMIEAFGETSASGNWTQRDSFIASEIAILLALRHSGLSSGSKTDITALQSLAALLPTQTVRSEDQVAFQHFSTPLTLSWLVTRMAAIGTDDIVLEPSAGTGMLAQWVREGIALHLNELDPARAEILRQLFPSAIVTTEDAARISQTGLRPSVILMNPPFARNAMGRDDPLAAARHFAAAATALAPGGRLVAIMPDSFSGQGRSRDVFDRATRGCSIAAHLRLENAFRAHGTGVPVRVIALDKVTGKARAPVVQRPDLECLLPMVEAMPPRQTAQVTSSGPLMPPQGEHQPSARQAVFKGFGKRQAIPASTTLSLAAASGPTWIDASYIAVEGSQDDPDDAGVYAAWRPQRIRFPGAAEHPAALVESAAMASVLPSLPSYVPRLPCNAIDGQVLSDA